MPKEVNKEEKGSLEEISKFLNVNPNQVPSRAEEIFIKWKKNKKTMKKGKEIEKSHSHHQKNSQEMFLKKLLNY